MGEIKKMKVSELYPHPKNSEIYGQDEDVSDLVEKIRRSGQVHTLVVNSNGVILAGHRRCKACKELGIDEVDVEIRNFESAEQEIEYIIDNNATREKTREQKGREAMALKEVIAIIAYSDPFCQDSFLMNLSLGDKHLFLQNIGTDYPLLPLMVLGLGIINVSRTYHEVVPASLIH